MHASLEVLRAIDSLYFLRRGQILERISGTVKIRGLILENVYGTVNIKCYPKPNYRAVTQIRLVLKEVSRIAAIKFTIKFA